MLHVDFTFPALALKFVKPAATCENLPYEYQNINNSPWYARTGCPVQRQQETMAHHSNPHSFLQKPPSSPQAAAHSNSTDSMHDLHPIPLLIQYQTGTLHSPTTGHAFISVNPFVSLASLTKIAIQAFRETHNPNNSNVIPGTASVECLTVHWGAPPAREPGALAFPPTTRLSEENLEVVLTFMRHCRGAYDFLEIRFREPVVAIPPLGSFPIGSSAKVAPSQSLNKKKEQGDLSKGAGRGFEAPPRLDYGS